MNSRIAASSIGRPAREGLQPIVGVRDSMGAHDGLHRLAEHLPGAVQILRQPGLVELDFCEAGRRAIDRRERRGRWRRRDCAARSSRVRSRCRRDIGSLSAKCASRAFASPKLPSAFSKSMGLTLCGMVEEPTSPATDALPEVAERDVAPHVAREIEKHGIGAHERVAVLGDPIVRLDLRGVAVRLQAERFDELRAEARPIDVRQGRDMRVEIADRAVHLAQDDDALETGPLTLAGARPTLASSLPTVVGVAVWPCVRANMPTAACRIAQ